MIPSPSEIPPGILNGTQHINNLNHARGISRNALLTVTFSVTISGGADDIWIFQISGDLTMSSAAQITLEGGAQAKNIFWQIAGQATIGTTAHFEGIILSKTGITFQTSASINGRALAQTAVILDGNAVTKPQRRRRQYHPERRRPGKERILAGGKLSDHRRLHPI